MSETPQTPGIRHYFVDEAGDPVLFSAKKKIIVGSSGCSAYFILGKVEIDQPDEVSNALQELRLQLLADPYFKNVPSMRVEQRKTALGFHAKDDLPEVRREVFRLLESRPFRFFAVVRDKRVIADKVIEQNSVKPTYRYHTNHLYDRCTSDLLKERLHKGDSIKIVFARRGTKDRTDALHKAIEAARTAFRMKWGISGAAPIEIVEADCNTTVCLQVADYCLWALQRFFERNEDRFLNLIESKIGLIHDRDDTRESGAGMYYTQKKRLTLESRAKK
jgi:hypothetical protein